MKTIIDLKDYKTAPPRWTGYTMACQDGAWYVGVTNYADACWRRHANGQHPFTRQHPPRVVAVRYLGRTQATTQMWQRRTIAKLKRLLPHGALIGNSQGRTQLAKREPWQVGRTPKGRKLSKPPISTVPLSSL